MDDQVETIRGRRPVILIADEKLDCGRTSRPWIGCPIHGSRFELTTGRAMGPPETRPIATYGVRVADDWNEVLA